MRKLVLIFMLLIVALLIINGCQGSESKDIKSDEDVSEAVIDISQNIDDISSTIKDIDSDLG